MPPYWEVDRPPPCDVLKLRGQTLKFGISGRGIISPPNGDAVLSDRVPEWDNGLFTCGGEKDKKYEKDSSLVNALVAPTATA